MFIITTKNRSIKLSETQLHNLIRESVKKVLRENGNQLDFIDQM